MATDEEVAGEPLLRLQGWYAPRVLHPMPLIEEAVRLIVANTTKFGNVSKGINIIDQGRHVSLQDIKSTKTIFLEDGSLWNRHDYVENNKHVDLFYVSKSHRWSIGCLHRERGPYGSVVVVDKKWLYRPNPHDETTIAGTLWLSRFPSLVTIDDFKQEAGAPKLLAFIDQIIGVFRSQPGCYQAWVDCAPAIDLSFGHLYGQQRLGQIAWRQAVEQQGWNSAGPERRGRVRAPVWGTYLGPDLAKKLGDPAAFVKEYEDWAKTDDYVKHDGPPPHAFERVTIFPDGALFIRISHNPLDTYFHYTPPWESESALRAAAWLWERYRKAGMV